MKPAPFAYARAASLTELFDLVERHGPDAKILAGGQSLVASLNLRLSEPAILIDINRIAELGGLSMAGDRLRIGALTRQRELEESPLVARHAPLIAAAMPHIAHPAIRTRGTIGGSLAFADPAAELPACAVALDASFVLRRRDGERRIGAAEFFKGLYETALEPGEVLAAVEVPVARPDTRSGFMELARRHGDYAMVGLAAHARLDGARIGEIRLVFFGVGTGPVSAETAAQALIGRHRDGDGIAAAQAALDEDLDPPADLNGGPATKKHLARVLLGRVVAELVQPAGRA